MYIFSHLLSSCILIYILIWVLQEGMAYDLIVGTTKMVSGHSLTETYVGKMDDL